MIFFGFCFLLMIPGQTFSGPAVQTKLFRNRTTINWPKTTYNQHHSDATLGPNRVKNQTSWTEITNSDIYTSLNSNSSRQSTKVQTSMAFTKVQTSTTTTPFVCDHQNITCHRGDYCLVQSPFWPKVYGNGLSCVWYLTVPEFSVVALNFIDFSIEANFDWLEIFTDHSTKAENLLVSFTGSNYFNLEGNRNKMTLRFLSDGVYTDTGFSLQFFGVFVDPFKRALTTAKGGLIISPSYPIPYHSGISVSWSVIMTNQDKDTLSILVHVKSVALADEDYLEIFSALQDDQRYRAARISGTVENRDFYVCSRMMLARFTSKMTIFNNTQRGFVISFKAKTEWPSECDAFPLYDPGLDTGSWSTLTVVLGVVLSVIIISLVLSQACRYRRMQRNRRRRWEGLPSRRVFPEEPAVQFPPALYEAEIEMQSHPLPSYSEALACPKYNPLDVNPHQTEAQTSNQHSNLYHQQTETQVNLSIPPNETTNSPENENRYQTETMGQISHQDESENLNPTQANQNNLREHENQNWTPNETESETESEINQAEIDECTNHTDFSGVTDAENSNSVSTQDQSIPNREQEMECESTN